jgi:hypothetical protein
MSITRLQAKIYLIGYFTSLVILTPIQYEKNKEAREQKPCSNGAMSFIESIFMSTFWPVTLPVELTLYGDRMYQKKYIK